MAAINIEDGWVIQKEQITRKNIDQEDIRNYCVVLTINTMAQQLHNMYVPETDNRVF